MEVRTVPAAAPAPGRLPIHEDPERIGAWPDADVAELAAWLADHRWLDEDSGPPAGYLVEDPEQDGPDSGGPASVEVWKAGRWDRSRGDGGGFAAGGAADRLLPGPVLAGLAGDRWAAGLERLTDDELIGVLRAGRRLASWAAAMELAAAADLWRRRTGEEDAGDSGAAWHADDELAAALTLTRRAAEGVLELAVGLARLPATAAALAAGDIDLPRAKVIAEELTGLADAQAARVERAVVRAAPGLTTGQLRAAARQAVQAADPDAARKRKEQALREARVERWSEPAGTAALAGRDLPPAQVLAADANLTALAQQLKAAGGEGTLDTMRAQIYLALLTGTPAASLLATEASGNPDTASRGDPDTASRGDPDTVSRSGPDTVSHGDPDTVSRGDSDGSRHGSGGQPGNGDDAGDVGPATGSGSRPQASGPAASADSGAGKTACGSVDNLSSATPGSPWPGASPGELPGVGTFGAVTAPGRVHLTLPLATWLGRSDAPGHAAGYGPLDATDSRALADALAAHAGTKWCLTITGPDGRPVAHGCARAGPPAGSRDHPGTGSRAGPPASDRPPARSRAGPNAGASNRPRIGSPAGAWTFSLTPLDGGRCDHAWETAAYRPSDALRHRVNIRHATCVFPGCRRPATQCDADHTIAYERGGRTCLCNLAPLCRRHHQAKQAPGWRLEQVQPGVMIWTTPSGRRYTTGPGAYP
jgi:hypothetical protein